jgi:hypothetical protein
MSQKSLKDISDSNYIRSYDTTVTTRLYFSQKYLALNIKDGDSSLLIKYWPHKKLAIGLGATYGWLTINLSVGVVYLNQANKSLEKTKTLDLQAHLYGPKVGVDFLGLYYKGFFLHPKGTATSTNNWYARPDLALTQIGISGYYVLNWRKFSYRAAYLQNEWQVKSGGSFLLGADIFYEQASADSAFIPSDFKNSFGSAGIQKIVFGDIGPGAGYAYTLVLAKHFFITGSATGTLSVNLLKEWDENTSRTKFSFNPNYALKAGIGYNTRRFTTSFTWVNNSVIAKGSQATYTILAGNARFHIAYRFLAGSKIKQKLKPFLKFFI